MRRRAQPLRWRSPGACSAPFYFSNPLSLRPPTPSQGAQSFRWGARSPPPPPPPAETACKIHQPRFYNRRVWRAFMFHNLKGCSVLWPYYNAPVYCYWVGSFIYGQNVPGHRLIASITKLTDTQWSVFGVQLCWNSVTVKHTQARGQIQEPAAHKFDFMVLVWLIRVCVSVCLCECVCLFVHVCVRMCVCRERERKCRKKDIKAPDSSTMSDAAG